MLAFWLIIKPFMPIIGKILAVLALAAAIWWAWAHFIKDPYIAQGVAQEHKQTVIEESAKLAAQAANARLAADVTALQAKVAESNASIAAMQSDEASRVAASKALLAAYAAREKELLAQIAGLAAISQGPPAPTFDEACHEADRTLSDLAAHRVRQ